MRSSFSVRKPGYRETNSQKAGLITGKPTRKPFKQFGQDLHPPMADGSGVRRSLALMLHQHMDLSSPTWEMNKWLRTFKWLRFALCPHQPERMGPKMTAACFNPPNKPGTRFRGVHFPNGVSSTSGFFVGFLLLTFSSGNPSQQSPHHQEESR